LVVAPGEVINLTNGYVVGVGASVSFTSEGTVNVENNTAVGGVFGFWSFLGDAPGTFFWNKVGATFRVSGLGAEGQARGIVGGGNVPDITNDGLIEVLGGLNAVGIENTSDVAHTIINNGVLRVTATIDYAIGIQTRGALNNAGQIDVAAGGKAVGVLIDNPTSSLTNSGLIRATSVGATPSIAVELFTGPNWDLTITNTASGTMEGDYVFKERLGTFSDQGGRHTIENAGAMNGVVDVGLADDHVHNTGAITGAVALGQGDDAYDGGGTLTGALFGGFGVDTITGGSGGEVFHGEEGNDIIDGGAGDDVLDGGHGADTLNGGLDADRLYGGYENDVLHGGDGADELDGWQGADMLYGEAGADTIVISNAAYSTGATFDTAIGFDFAEDKIRLTTAPTAIDAAVAGGALSLATFGADLAAAVSPTNLSAGGALLFSPATGDFAGSSFIVVDANNIAGYQDGADIVVRLQAPTNLGQFGLSTFVAGASTYQPLALEFTSSPLHGQGREIYGDFTIHDGETLHTTQQSFVLGLAVANQGASAAPIVVTNAGDALIENAPGFFGLVGIGLTQDTSNFDLTLRNTATGDFAVNANFTMFGTIWAKGAIVRHFDNAGHFAVTSNKNATGVELSFGNATFVNTGVIDVAATVSALGVLVDQNTNRTAAFENHGMLTVHGGVDAQYAEGVRINAGTTTFQNSGTIAVTVDSVAIDSIAINYDSLVNGGPNAVLHIVNSGLIEAEFALVANARTTLTNTGTVRGNITFSSANDVYDGALGTLVGLLSAGDGNDTIGGGVGAESFIGGSGDDFIQGRGGADNIQGGDDNDWLDGGAGGDTIDGGNGTRDIAAYGSSSAAVNLDLQANTYTGGDAAGDVLTNIEGLSGSSFADQLFGNANDNRLFGQGGNDFIQGRGGNDIIDGGDGDDWLDGGAGADQIFGGAGTNDVVAYGASAAAVNADLQAFTFTGGDAAGDTYSGVEGVSGSSFGDQLFGNASANRLFGQGGNDFIQGRGGNDIIDGGNGDDWLDGGAGGDQIFGGAGANDVVAYGASTAAVTVDMAAFSFSGGDATGDTYSGIEGVSGSSLGDQISGDANANRLFGQAGTDTLAGRGGNDYLQGGNDNDIFVFANNGGIDTIADFDDFGNDVIQLSISGITNFQAVRAVMTQVGADVRIDFATTDIILTNTTLASMGADDFTFV
jgi:Ca2+-binding RTX toxin-like protein